MPGVADAGRVVTGAAKGVRLLAPGPGTRPLSDRVKTALFGTLEAEGAFGDLPFLDLFAGSGAAGIEALSRGAPGALLVERDPGAGRVIEENLRRTRLEGGRVFRADVLRFLEGEPRAAGGPFGAALVDPPYDAPLLVPTLERLGSTAGWLAPGGIVVAKHFWRDAPPPVVGELAAYRERRFGETMLTFYRLASHAED